MAALPPPPTQTLDAIDRAMAETMASEQPRPYLGMSQVGDPCRRRLWLGFRWAGREQLSTAAIRRIQDGVVGEEVMAKRLQMVPGIVLETINKRTGQQWACSAIGGHLRGHLDGIVLGVREAPSTPHVWEHKQVGISDWKKLVKLREERGEKAALAAWNPRYYAQGQLYMHFWGLDRHFLTVATPGGREITTVRTEANPEATAKLVERAVSIIRANEPPEGVSRKPDWWQCKACAYHPLCHTEALPEVNCRTCAHSTPDESADGAWVCAIYPGCAIPQEWQRTGCDRHLYITPMVPAEQIGSSQEGNWVEYRTKDGRTFRNGISGYSSKEIKVNFNACGDPTVALVRQRFGAEVVG